MISAFTTLHERINILTKVIEIWERNKVKNDTWMDWLQKLLTLIFLKISWNKLKTYFREKYFLFFFRNLIYKLRNVGSLMQWKGIFVRIQLLVAQFSGRRWMFVVQSTANHSIALRYTTRKALVLDEVSTSPICITVRVCNLLIINESTVY